MGLQISEYRPSDELLPFVQSYWFGDFNLKSEQKFSQSVVPNGCIELIIHLSDAHCSLNKGHESWDKSPDFTILGLYTQPYEVRFSKFVNVFGIRFYPDGIRNIFGIPPAEFLATFDDGADILGKSLHEFCDKIRSLDRAESQIKLADNFIRSQLRDHYLPYDYTHIAMNLIRKTAGISAYQQLTKQVPISGRQLQREFKKQYGITVSEYMRLSRMNATQNYILSKNASLSRISHDLQFSDQSHFIREFKNYVGLSPGKFMKNRHKFIVNPAVSE